MSAPLAPTSGAAAPSQQGRVSVETLGRILDLSARRIQQLVAAGVLPKAERGQYPLIPCIQAYIKYWRERAERPDGTEGPRAAILAARARLVVAEAHQAELVLAERLRALVPVEFAAQQAELLLETLATSLRASAAKNANLLIGTQDYHAAKTAFLEAVNEGLEAARRAVLQAMETP